MLFNDDLFAEMGTIFGLPTGNEPSKKCVRYSVPSFPPAKVFVDNQNNFCLNFALAGYSKEDLSISYDGDMIIISTTEAFSKKGTEEVAKKIYTNSIKNVAFKYSYLIPNDVDKEKVSASFKDGILSVKIPAKEEKKKDKMTIRII